jgi:hypothetical protein
VKNLHTQLTEQNNKIKEAEDQEIELRKKTRELEEQQRQMRIEYERNYDTELRKRIDKISDDHKLKDAEKDKQLNDMQKQIEELNRKSQQASQQAQGEVLEIELENSLRQEFFYDDIKPVAKGVRGADVIQTVRGQNGMDCGTIIWEAKRTKNWQQDWIQKLKDDQRDAKANVAVIVTIAMPKDVERIRNIDGVWVCDFATYIGLATALRAGIIDVAHVRLAMQGKSEKTEMLYNYFSGNEFRQRMETILDTFITMRAELDSEKRAIMKQWAAREKQIDKITQASSFLYGDVKGIIGSALAPIDSLELPGKEVKELPFGNEEG